MADTVWLWRIAQPDHAELSGGEHPGAHAWGVATVTHDGTCSTRGIPSPTWARFRSAAITSLTS